MASKRQISNPLGAFPPDGVTLTLAQKLDQDTGEFQATVAADIPAATVVQFDTVAGTPDTVTGQVEVAATSASTLVVGVTNEPIGAGRVGDVVHHGAARVVATGSTGIGDILIVSATVPGAVDVDNTPASTFIVVGYALTEQTGGAEIDAWVVR